MIMTLQTKRLELHEMTLDDAPALFTLWSHPDVTRFMNIDRFTDEQQARDMITLLTELAAENKALRFSIFDRDSGELIGSCGYNHFDRDNLITEIGYDVLPTHWGKGLGTEAVGILTKHAFEVLGMNRIEAKVEAGNDASSALLEKVGYHFEGTLREGEKSKGRYVDMKLYAILRSDWIPD
ncbi:GNAT family N-acetyltransferase [Rossellomorea marisflavi]|uniref:GNAT family N-acetyltransferase n=1 Tax=Rossellomorea marisflavi TaxID=189381 RepID=UPI0040446F64